MQFLSFGSPCALVPSLGRIDSIMVLCWKIKYDGDDDDDEIFNMAAVTDLAAHSGL